MSKTANAAHSISDLLARRFSPYAFADKPVPAAELRSLFEAARWSPSSYNEQPWAYIVARREDQELFANVLGCLVEGNQTWARHAPVLALGCLRTRFARNNNENHHARHDLGSASMALTIEAADRNLCVHQMAGILPDVARNVFSIPDDCEAVTGLAIGYLGDGANLPEQIRQRDAGERSRKPQSEFVYGSAWGTQAGWLE